MAKHTVSGRLEAGWERKVLYHPDATHNYDLLSRIDSNNPTSLGCDRLANFSSAHSRVTNVLTALSSIYCCVLPHVSPCQHPSCLHLLPPLLLPGEEDYRDPSSGRQQDQHRQGLAR